MWWRGRFAQTYFAYLLPEIVAFMQKNESVADVPAFALVPAIRLNDDAALKTLYTENYPKVEIFVLKNNGTADEAKDVYQEAFIAVWRNLQLERFSGNDSALAGYLYRIAKNKWLDHLRSGQYKHKLPLTPQIENGMEADDGLTGDEQQYLQAVRENFGKLGEACRELLRRFYYGREPLKVIATGFGWTEATAKNNKYRCLQRLRDLIKK